MEKYYQNNSFLLQKIIKANNTNIIKILYETNFDFNKKDFYGITPLFET